MINSLPLDVLPKGGPAMTRNRYLVLVTLLLSLLSSVAHAQWVANGIAICTAPNLQAKVQMVPDTQGGAILVWVDSRNSPDDHIYAQRVNAWGFRQWASDGIPVCTAPGDQGFVKAIPDGTGGAIVAWSDGRSGSSDIYAQRLDADGVALWAAQGVLVNGAAGPQYDAKLVSDGDSGAILVWTDGRDALGPTDWNIYAQRINYNGLQLWTPPGVVVCMETGAQQFPLVASDGQHGAIVVWEDRRNMATMHEDQYMQRLSGASVALWGAGGVPLANSPDADLYPALAADGSGGALFAWGRSFFSVHTQRVNSAGAAQWGAGIQLCNTSSSHPAVIDDEAGGAIVTWNDFRGGAGGSEGDVYGARYTDAGQEWGGSNGLAVVDAPFRQGAEFLPMIHNAPGQWMIAWMDNRDGLYDIYAHLSDIDSNFFWPDDGIAVSTAPGDQTNPVMIPDGAGGALLAWEDARNFETDDGDIYALRIDGNGEVTGVGNTPPAAAALRVEPNVPNPFAASTEIRFDLAAAAETNVEIFDVAGRRVLTRALGSLGAGPHAFQFDGRDGHGATIPSGEYFYRVTAAGTARSGKFVLTR